MEYSRSLVRSLDKSSRITLSATDHVTTFYYVPPPRPRLYGITHQNTCVTPKW